MNRVQKVFDNFFWVGSFCCGFLAEVKLESIVELCSSAKHLCPKIGVHEHPMAAIQIPILALELDRQ